MAPPGHFVAVLQTLCCNSRGQQSPLFIHSSVLQEGTVQLLISGQHGAIVRIRTRTDTPLRKCMLAYAKNQNLQADEYVLIHDGGTVFHGQTCQDLDLQSGDSLHAMKIQVGD